MRLCMMPVCIFVSRLSINNLVNKIMSFCNLKINSKFSFKRYEKLIEKFTSNQKKVT